MADITYHYSNLNNDVFQFTPEDDHSVCTCDHKFWSIAFLDKYHKRSCLPFLVHGYKKKAFDFSFAAQLNEIRHLHNSINSQSATDVVK